MRKNHFVLEHVPYGFKITEPLPEHQTTLDPTGVAKGKGIFLHSHLSDVRLLINRTLVYGALTAIVVGIYVAVVGYLGLLFEEPGDEPRANYFACPWSSFEINTSWSDISSTSLRYL